MIPTEVTTFLQEPGRTILVRGTAGTGKTLFAVEVARAYQAKGGDVLWISSRHADPSEAIDLDEVVPEANQRSAVGVSPPPTPSGRVPPHQILEELERDVDQADSLVVVDSLDGLMAGAPAKDIEEFITSAKALATRTGIRLMLVLESGEERTDHLTDGVVHLEQAIVEGSRARHLVLRKLRGQPLPNPVYPFTLHGGRFKAYSPEKPTSSPQALRVPGMTAREGHWTTGITGWDILLDGGFRNGSVHLLTFSPESARDVGLLTVPFALNSLAAGRRVLWASMPNARREGDRVLAMRHVDERQAARLHLVQPSDLPAHARTLPERLAPLTRTRDPKGQASILSLDALRVGSAEGRDWLADWCQATRQHGGVDLLVASEEHGPELAVLADDWWRLSRLHGAPTLRGVAPPTEFHFLHARGHKGYPETILEAVH